MPGVNGCQLPAGESRVAAYLPEPKTKRFPCALKARHLPGVLREWDGVMPGHIPPVAMLNHHGRVGDDLEP